MNGLDIILLLVLLIIGMICLMKGLIKTIFFFISMIAASICSILFYRPVGDIINKFINNNMISVVLAYILIFLAVSIACHLFAKGLKKVLKIAHLGWADRAGGLLIGLIIGIFLNSVLIILLTVFSTQQNQIIHESMLAPHILQISQKTIAILPSDLKETFQKKVKEITIKKLSESF